MGEEHRELTALRTIVVSGRAALHKTSDAAGRARIKDRVAELLSELEASVLREGADPEVLRRLHQARGDALD